MRITKKQLIRIIKEATVQSYDLGREDSLAGIRPQLPDEDYMRGYNDAQMDAGLPTMQAPSDSGRGKKLDPNLLKGALPGKIRGMSEAHHDHSGYDDDLEDYYEERRLMDMDDRVRDVPQEMMDRVMNLRRGDLQDHMLDLVDAYEAKFEEQPGGIPLSMLVKNLEQAERMDESRSNKSRTTTDVLKDTSSRKARGINEARNVSFPFTEIAEDFQDRGYKVKKAAAGDERGAALFQMPISIPGGTKDFGYYVDVKYEYGTFYFYWYLRTKASPGSQQRIKILKPGGGKPRWQAEYRESDLGVVVDEIDYEISVHAEEGKHPFDLGLPPSKFAYKG